MSAAAQRQRRETPALLDVRGVHKRFPGVHALRGVDLAVEAAEIHALVGENGAGKSTLMHLLAGVHQPDAGELRLDGRPFVVRDEREAQERGVGIVYQERSLFADLTVAENVFAGRQPRGRWGLIDRRRLARDTAVVLDTLGLHLDPDLPLSALTPAEHQMVEIAKALSINPRLLILDEPTAALTEPETEALFSVLARLRGRGLAIIYISHRLKEIFRIADRVTVLRDGAGQGTMPVSDASPDKLVARMVGRDLVPASITRREQGANALLLQVRGLRDQVPCTPGVRGVDLAVRAGEIVALAGLAGAGRTELALCLCGARPFVADQVTIAGRQAHPRSPREAMRAGLGYLSEDRKELGLFLDRSVVDNTVLPLGGGAIDEQRRRHTTRAMAARLQLRYRDLDQEVRSLSGGNQQKVLLGRLLLQEPEVLIVDEPTRGVDVGAKEEIHALLRDVASQGRAVLVISSDLPEVLALADRVLVMRDGRIAAELPGSDASEEVIMRHAAGAAA